MGAIKRVFAPCLVTLLLICLSIPCFASSPFAVNSIGYATLADALAAAQSGDTIVVQGTATVSAAQTIPSGITLYINPNVTLYTTAGLTIAGELVSYGNIESGQITSISDGGVVTLNYGSLTRTNSGAAVRVYDGGTLNIMGGTISTGAGNGVDNQSGSTVNFNSGTINFGTSAFTNQSDVNFNNNDIDTDTSGSMIVKPAVLAPITDVVHSATSWISSFANAITSNEIVLIFVVVAFVGLGVGLIRRLMM